MFHAGLLGRKTQGLGAVRTSLRESDRGERDISGYELSTRGVRKTIGYERSTHTTIPGEDRREVHSREPEERCCPLEYLHPLCSRGVDIRLHEKGNSELPWRKAGQPRH